MATVKDIAKLSGVSPSTVSIILNGKSEQRKISQNTCQKVWEAVRVLGYQPNIAARTLRDRGERTVQTIALYWANGYRTSLLSRFLKGLENTENGDHASYEIVVFTYSNDELCKQEALLSGKRFHAAIIANASEKDMEFINSVVFPVPIVLYNRYSPEHYCVTVDNYKMGQLAAKALLEKARKKPWILDSTDVFPGMKRRVEGFIDNFENSGIAVPKTHICLSDNTLASGNEMIQKLVQQKEFKENCDSIFCLSSAIAHGCLFALNRNNIKVPQEISVISIGSGEDSYHQFCIPPLSNVHLPMEKMANACLDTLLKLLNHKEPEEKNILFDTPLHILES